MNEYLEPSYKQMSSVKQQVMKQDLKIIDSSAWYHSFTGVCEGLHAQV